ncbi:MAG: transglutaminase domain-containing protein [Planctomycetota bacterium]
MLAWCHAAWCPQAWSQLLDADAAGEASRYDEPVVGLFRVGAEITASRGPVKDIQAMVAVPFECDEQQVRIVEEDFTASVEGVAYRDLQAGARQMLISVPYLGRGEQARAIVTFEVTTKPILPPSDEAAAELTIPRRLPRDLRRFTSVSPYIEAKNRKIRSLARDIQKEAPQDASDWQKIELFYDYMLDNIKYVEGPDTSAVTTLKEGSADCHGRSALFVALCRASDVPARIVWVNGHCYAEFYLEDAEGQGQWYPIESAGSRAFGEMPLGRVILQKGDNFRLPERPKDRLRYATDFLTGLPLKGSGKPRVKYIREAL